jgi:hypothetical protein
MPVVSAVATAASTSNAASASSSQRAGTAAAEDAFTALAFAQLSVTSSLLGFSRQWSAGDTMPASIGQACGSTAANSAQLPHSVATGGNAAASPAPAPDGQSQSNPSQPACSSGPATDQGPVAGDTPSSTSIADALKASIGNQLLGQPLGKGVVADLLKSFDTVKGRGGGVAADRLPLDFLDQFKEVASVDQQCQGSFQQVRHLLSQLSGYPERGKTYDPTRKGYLLQLLMDCAIMGVYPTEHTLGRMSADFKGASLPPEEAAQALWATSLLWKVSWLGH